MFQAVTKRVRSEFCKECQPIGIEQYSEQNTDGDDDLSGRWVPARVASKKREDEDQKWDMYGIEGVGEARQLAGGADAERFGEEGVPGGEQQPKKARGEDGQQIVAEEAGKRMEMA